MNKDLTGISLTDRLSHLGKKKKKKKRESYPLWETLLTACFHIIALCPIHYKYLNKHGGKFEILFLFLPLKIQKKSHGTVNGYLLSGTEKIVSSIWVVHG